MAFSRALMADGSRTGSSVNVQTHWSIGTYFTKRGREIEIEIDRQRETDRQRQTERQRQIQR